MTWDPAFLDRSPMLAPLAQSADALRACSGWPRRSLLQAIVDARGITNARGVALRLVAASQVESYESSVYERGELYVREGQWHDLFNVLAWLAYPRTKAALNVRHVEALRDRSDVARGTALAGNRGRVQDALTVFDESGAIFATPDAALVEDLRAFRWKQLFWTRRRRVLEGVRVFVFGHAIFEKALAPYVGMTAHALPIVVADGFMAEPLFSRLAIVDELAAKIVAESASLATPQDLAPLPLLGVPGWWQENEHETFYDDTEYLRPGRWKRK